MARKKIALIAAASAVIFLMVGAMSNIQRSPGSLSLGFSSHDAVPAVMKMSLNGRTVIDHSEKGRIEVGGGIDYVSGQGDALDFDVAWYDIFEDQGYAAKFRLQASDLSWIGSSGHATVDIVVGPGADVTATTLNAEVAKLIRERRGKELPSLSGAPDIVLAELCADRLDAASALVQSFKEDVERYKGGGQREANDRMRARYLAKNGSITSRCNKD